MGKKTNLGLAILSLLLSGCSSSNKIQDAPPPLPPSMEVSETYSNPVQDALPPSQSSMEVSETYSNPNTKPQITNDPLYFKVIDELNQKGFEHLFWVDQDNKITSIYLNNTYVFFVNEYKDGKNYNDETRIDYQLIDFDKFPLVQSLNMINGKEKEEIILIRSRDGLENYITHMGINQFVGKYSEKDWIFDRDPYDNVIRDIYQNNQAIDKLEDIF